MATIFLKCNFVVVLVFVCVKEFRCLDPKPILPHDGNPCVYKFEEGKTSLDLTRLVPEGKLLTATSGNVTYRFGGCRDLEAKCNNEKSSLCRYDTTANATKEQNLGDVANAELTESLTYLSPYDIYYKKGNAVISLICSPKLKDSEFSVESPNSKVILHNLVVFSSSACVIHEPSLLSTGSTLLIIFFVVLQVYLICGALVLYFIRGARGIEIIPNLDFWRELPSLVKDGMLFILNGCNPVTLPSSEAYDRI